MKKVLGFVSLLIGIVMILISIYIKVQIVKGQELVGSAKEKVEMGKSIFSLTPQSKELGKGLTKGIDKKIALGEEEIAKYTTISNVTLYGGIFFIIVGAFVIFWKKRK